LRKGAEMVYYAKHWKLVLDGNIDYKKILSIFFAPVAT